MNPVDNTMRVSDNLEEICRKAKAPLSDRQILLIRGALMVWLPKLQDEANRELLDRVDAAMTRGKANVRKAYNRGD